MSSIAPGWYPDPVDPTIQRYWDGEGYLGEPIPSDATPPPGPPADATPQVPPAQVSPAQVGTPDRPTQGQTPGLQGQSPGLQGQAAGQETPDQAPSGSHNIPAGVANSTPTQVTAPPGAPPAQPQGQPQGPSSQPGPYPPGIYPPVRQPGPHPAGQHQPGQHQPGQYPPGQYPPGSVTPPYGNPPPPGIHPTGQMPGWPAYPRLVLPAPRPHGYRLAGLGARFVARFVDLIAVLGLNVLVNGYFVYQYYKINLPYWQAISTRFYKSESLEGIEPPARSSTLLVIILVLAAALWFAYEVPSHANTGQTLGKRLLGIKVMRLESDEALGFRRSIRRWNTLGLPTLLWTCFGLGFVLQFVDCLWAAVDRPLHQALHDKSAVTVVVQAGPKPTTEAQPNHDQQGRPA